MAFCGPCSRHHRVPTPSVQNAQTGHALVAVPIGGTATFVVSAAWFVPVPGRTTSGQHRTPMEGATQE
eukprot:5653376-Prorocentrum_lima.AAC.1